MKAFYFRISVYLLMGFMVCSVFSSCSKGNDDNPFGIESGGPDKEVGSNNKKDFAVTGGCVNIDMTTVTLRGYVNLIIPEEMGIEVWQGSDIKSAQTLSRYYKKKASSFEQNNRFVLDFNNLTPYTQYNYRTVVSIADLTYYGETLSFTTKDYYCLAKVSKVELDQLNATIHFQIDKSSTAAFRNYIALSTDKEQLSFDNMGKSENIKVYYINSNPLTIKVEPNLTYYYRLYTRHSNMGIFPGTGLESMYTLKLGDEIGSFTVASK